MALSYPATRAMLRARVRTRLLTSATATDHWSDDTINTYLNRAQGELQDELMELFDERYFIRTEEDVYPNEDVIVLPTDWLRVLSLGIASGASWLPCKLVHPSRTIEYRYGPLVTSGLPAAEVWSQIGENLEFQGPGSAANAGPYQLRLTYRVPDLQSDDDESKVPSRYHDLLVDLTAMYCAKDGREVERATLLAGDYQRGLDRLMRTAGRSAPAKTQRVRRVRNRGRF